MAEQQHTQHSANFKNLVGSRSGRLVVIAYAGRRNRTRGYWLCRCDCGKWVTLRTDAIGRTKSCGCLKLELQAKRSTTHGKSRSPEYYVWNNLVHRCTNPNIKGYPEYGGRGIRVCDRWLKFENFHADMGDRPSPQHSIDRINNDGNYEPGNCRWATATVQTRNNRHVRLYTFNGKTLCIADWAKKTGISKFVLQRRLSKLGWTIEQAITAAAASDPRPGRA
jgi:hypothetical protein